MSRFSIFIGFMLLTASCSVNKIKYGQNTLVLSDDRIFYYLEEGLNKSDTLLLAFQGSGCNSIVGDKFIDSIRSNFESFDLLFIEKPGITPSLQYDPNPERVDCPQLYLEKDNPEKRAVDALAVIDAVQSERQYKQIVVLGGSEGGLVSVLVAAKSDEVNAVISINGGGAFFINDVLHNIKATSPPEKVEESLTGFKKFASKIVSANPSPLVVSNHGFSWWKTVLSLDQSKYLKQIKVPVLVIQAENDQSVSPEYTVSMVNNLRNLGYKNIELVTYSSLDHVLAGKDGESHVAKVLADSRGWLNRILSTKP